MMFNHLITGHLLVLLMQSCCSTGMVYHKLSLAAAYMATKSVLQLLYFTIDSVDICEWIFTKL